MTTAVTTRPTMGATTTPPEAGGEGSIRRAGLVAGASLMLMAGLAVVGVFLAVDGLTTPGDAAATAADISDSQGVFRLGVLSLLAVVVLDVVVAWALFRVLAPVSASLSRLAAWLRLAYSVVFLVAVAQLAAVPRLLDGDGFASSLAEDDRQVRAGLALDSFHDLWTAGLILFGAHLLVVGYLVHRSGYLPRILGALVALAGLGYLVDSVGFFLTPDAPVVSTVTFVGEFVLGVWLLGRSHRLPGGTTGHVG